MESLNNELWVDVIGYDGYYMISNFGRFKSLERQFFTPKGVEATKPERILKYKYKNKGKVLFVQFSVDKINKQFHAAKMVALHFLKGYNNEQILYKDGDSRNINIDNLIIINKDNVLDFFNHSLLAMSNETSSLLHRYGLKRCSICYEIKQKINFSKSKRNRQVNNNCQNCVNILVNRYYHEKTRSEVYRTGSKFTSGTNALI